MTMVIDPIFALLGLGSGLAGLLTLYRAWLRKERSMVLLIAGWSALFGSLVFWSYAGGADRGVALGLIVICLAALLFVGYSATQQPIQKIKPVRKRNQVPKQQQSSSPAQLMKAIGAILFLGPVCGLLAFAIAMGLYEALDMTGAEKANSLVTALFAFPIIWSVIVSFSMISRRKILKTVILLSAPLVSAAIMFAGYA